MRGLLVSSSTFNARQHTTSPNSDVMDKAFFRDYKALDAETKDKLRDLVDLWGKTK